MKYLSSILAIIAGVVLISCLSTEDKIETKVDGCSIRFKNENFKTIEHDNCEYVLYEYENYKTYSGLTHKGNCKFCEQRKK